MGRIVEHVNATQVEMDTPYREVVVMHTVRLGRTGLMVSAVGFGGIPIQRLSEAQAIEVVRGCIDLGVTFLDTATGYTTSEERIGRAISGRREGLVIATKSPARDGAGVRDHLALSLQRLRLETIDLFQFHNVSERADFDALFVSGGPFEVICHARDEGVVGHIGFTTHSMEMALRATASGHFETVMFPFNFITEEAADRLIPLALQNDVGFIAMKPMGGGMLEDATLAFKYLRQFSGVVPIVGIEQTTEMEQIVEVMTGPADLTAEEKACMAQLRAELGTRFCRRCDYCQPCPEDIPISTLMTLPSAIKRLPTDSLTNGWVGEAVEQAAHCADCGECELRCPYHLPIRQMMDEHVSVYHHAVGRYGASAAI
ncbi:MAG: aldo/keto reductase [Chloroflexi bacterium]|nr:aldo/keto reductase [Chloroflexota bacterium]